MRERRWLLLTVYGVLLAVAASGALKATRPKFKIATTSTTTTSTVAPSSAATDAEDKNADDGITEATTAADANATTGHTLTGIPQIDYIWDPNLPRELNGYNLSDYPFYNSIPEDIDFKCDGLHDGFYASVPHKCQVYHHCLYGTRYDFLCANFTAFDQKTFICHFVSEVDCANSKKYWHRNDALYKATTSSTSTTSTTPRPTTTTTTTTASPVHDGHRDRDAPRRRRPFRWRPSYDYYDEEYYDEEYERGRLYGYDRRIYDDYEDRKYRRDRERDFPERSFRDRTERPPRAERERDREISPRERFPMRRDPARGTRDPVDEDRPRSREPDTNSRFRDAAETDFDERRPPDWSRDTDERRYSDGKRFKDEYDDKELPMTSATTGGSTEGLVKPAAPPSSVYARPRAIPKIRRPVPLSEQERFAYKTSSPPPVVEEPRRRPVDLADDDYYDDDFEDIRPRRPLRRRPNYRDRDLYDTRDRDRLYRTRYRDEDDLRPRKHPLRDRYYERERGYERGRDRALDRGTKDRDRTLGRSQQDQDKPERPPYRPPMERERETTERPRMLHNLYEHRTTEKPREPPRENHELKKTLPEEQAPTRLERPPFRPGSSRIEAHYPPSAVNEEENQSTMKELPEKFWRPTSPHPDPAKTEEPRVREIPVEEYPSEYYDEEEPLSPPAAPPRPTVRVVKRPFLPSRGGSPNPRGLLPVGAKAVPSGRQDEGRNIAHENTPVPVTTPESKRYNDPLDQRIYQEKVDEDKRIYDAYKVIQSDLQQKRVTDTTGPSTSSSIHVSPGGTTGHQDQDPIPNWTLEEPVRQDSSSNGQRASTENPYSTVSYKDDDSLSGPTGPGGLRAKQRLNEVVTPHRLQDIPESEYDVTLNDALTPTLNHQETSLPSGFVLPLHRQPTGRDTLLQPSENDYEYSRPISQPQQQQQKPFVPSPRFVPPSINRNERPKTVYYRTPETIHVAATAPQYRQQRGPWHDYGAFR